MMIGPVHDWQDQLARQRGIEMCKHPSIRMNYANYKARVGEVNIAPFSMRYGSSEWHPHDQWLLSAFNTDRRVSREYALHDVLWWSCTEPWCSLKCCLYHWAGWHHEVNRQRWEHFCDDESRRRQEEQAKRMEKIWKHWADEEDRKAGYHNEG